MTSSIDLSSLTHLAHSRSPESRKALAAVMADLFVGEGRTLSDRERSLMLNILEQVIGDAERAVRRTLSRKLADMPDAPPDLIRYLAADEADVAFPVLTRSRVLFDEDLIEVIRNRTLEHQLAIAMRYSVSEAVSAALVESGEISVIERLLQNDNANLSQQTLRYLVDQARRMDAFQEPLLSRRELGAELARKLFLWVSAALRHRIVDRFALDSETVDLLLQQAALESIDADDACFGARPAPAPGSGLAGEVAEDGLLDASLMVQALAQGEVNLFVSLFARASHLSTRLVERIFFDPGLQAFAVACKGMGIDRNTFSRLFEFSRSARPATRKTLKKEIVGALACFDRLSLDTARGVLHAWRLNPDFAAALRALEPERRVRG